MSRSSARDLFEILVREHSERVRAFLLASCRDLSVAEDLLQETFLTAWRILERYDRELPFGPWVRGIAGRLVLNHRRKVGRARVHYCDAASMQLLDARFAEFDELPGDSFDEQLDVLRECMSVLTDTQRTVIDLHYHHGLTCRVIAGRIGLGVEAIKKHLQRGRLALSRCMQHKSAQHGSAQRKSVASRQESA